MSGFAFSSFLGVGKSETLSNSLRVWKKPSHTYMMGESFLLGNRFSHVQIIENRMISIMDGKEKPDNQGKVWRIKSTIARTGAGEDRGGDSPGEDRDGDSPGEDRDGDSPEGRDGDSPGGDRDEDSPGEDRDGDSPEDRDGDSPGEHCDGDSPDGDSPEDGDGVYPGEDCDGDSPKYSSLEEEWDELRRIVEGESPEVNLRRWSIRLLDIYEKGNLLK